MIKERILTDDDLLIVQRSQDVQSILDEAKHLRDFAPSRKNEMRHAGTIPFVIAEQWSRECGAAIGTKEFALYCRRKLMDGEFAKLRVHGF